MDTWVYIVRIPHTKWIQYARLVAARNFRMLWHRDEESEVPSSEDKQGQGDLSISLKSNSSTIKNIWILTACMFSRGNKFHAFKCAFSSTTSILDWQQNLLWMLKLKWACTKGWIKAGLSLIIINVRHSSSWFIWYLFY